MKDITEKIYTKPIEGLGIATFHITRVPANLPEDHPVRQYYDDRALEDQIDPGTDTYWVKVTDQNGIPQVITSFGTSAGKLNCIYISVPESIRRNGIATAIYDLVEGYVGKPIINSNIETDDSKAFWSARRRRA